MAVKKVSSIIVSGSTFAKLIGVSDEAFRKSMETAGIKRPENGEWELFDYLPTYVKWIKDREWSRTSPTKANLDALKAEKLQFEMDIMRGEYIKAEDATKIWSKVVHAVRSKILGIPKKTAFLILQCKTIAEAEDAIKKVTNNVLNELASPDMVEAASQIQKERRAKKKKHSKL